MNAERFVRFDGCSKIRFILKWNEFGFTRGGGVVNSFCRVGVLASGVNIAVQRSVSR